MKVLFSVSSNESEKTDFVKAMNMVALPQKDSLVDVGDRNLEGQVLRLVKVLFFTPDRVEVNLETQDTDTIDFLKRQGWKPASRGIAEKVLNNCPSRREWRALQALIMKADERNLGDLDYQLLSQVMREAEEVCNEHKIPLTQMKRIDLVLDFYILALEHNKQGLSLQERVAALKKIAEG